MSTAEGWGPLAPYRAPNSSLAKSSSGISRAFCLRRDEGCEELQRVCRLFMEQSQEHGRAVVHATVQCKSTISYDHVNLQCRLFHLLSTALSRHLNQSATCGALPNLTPGKLLA